jgi:hypothetical protein
MDSWKSFQLKALLSRKLSHRKINCPWCLEAPTCACVNFGVGAFVIFVLVLI